MRRWFCLIDATSFQTSPREFSLNPTGDVMLTVGDTTAISHDLFYSSWSKKNSGSLDLLSLWIFLLFLASLINFFPNGMTPSPLAPGGPPAGPWRPKLEAPSLRCLGRRHDSHPRATRAESNRWGNDGKMQATPPLLGSTPPGKSPLLVGEFTINGPFSIAMLNYQRVIYIYIYLVGGLEHKKIHILGMSSSQLTNSYFSDG